MGVVLAEIIVPDLFERSLGRIERNFLDRGGDRRIGRIALTFRRSGNGLSGTGRLGLIPLRILRFGRL
jgi:hypothetical protein